MKRKVLGISAGIAFLLFLLLAFAADKLWQGQISQTVALRWSDEKNIAHVSCFLSADAGLSTDTIEELEHRIDNDLADNGVLPNPEKPSARLWVDAYSAGGSVAITSDRTTISVQALGIGGDFFLFHPLKLRSGYYFSGNDVNQDYIVIDQDAAWQLFGSSNVAGMTVYIGNVPHVIAGVVERGDSRLEKAGGLKSSLVYMSYESLRQNGQCGNINHYEIVMPNPVTGYAVNYIKENLGGSEERSEVIENSKRYSFLSRVKRLKSFGTDSMRTVAFAFPYWENVARGYETYLSIITVFELIFLAYAIVVCIGLLRYWWKHKRWTVRGVWRIIVDKLERLGEKLRTLRIRQMKKIMKK